MIPEFGHFALILALCLALTQAVFPLFTILWGEHLFWLDLAKPAALGQFVFLLLSFACLLYAFISNDFTVMYVAQNSNTHLPLFYRMTALWGAHEGSLLLWVFILSIWGAAVCVLNKSLTHETQASVLMVLGWISVGFLLFLLMTSNPFQRLLINTPRDGADLNPLLQDPGLAIHPPMLYTGYVGFAVTFAFAIAGLLADRLDAVWARATRRWTLAAWCFLTFGITLGSWWAYRELGWGGWWFWDPVENASFLPWLVGTALIHSLIVVEKRAAFKNWTVLLAIIAFSLSLLGTFLVRSGILVSVHAFVSDPLRGSFLLKFLVVVIGVALVIYALRAPKVSAGGYFALCSRETFLLINNVLLLTAMFTVLLGTLYPLIIDAMGLGKISVGPPYFNTMFVPLMILLLIFMGIGPLCYWREMSFSSLAKRLLYPFLLAIGLSIILLLVIMHSLPIAVVVGLALSGWLIVSSLQTVAVAFWRQRCLQFITLKQFAMVFAHCGIALTVLGITLTSHYKVDREVMLHQGDTVTVGNYQFKFVGTQNLQGPNYTGTDALFQVSQNNNLINTLHAQKRFYTVQQTVMTIAGIDANLWRDLYIALGDQLPNNAWSVRIYIKPFVRWIWLGGLCMILGGILANWRHKALANAKPEKIS